MGYVTGYEHDVFISYAHIDNTPFGSEKGWVTAFVDDLKNYLDRGLGCRDVKIWMDRELTCNEAFAGNIEDALRNSATLLVAACVVVTAILSPILTSAVAKRYQQRHERTRPENRQGLAR